MSIEVAVAYLIGARIPRNREIGKVLGMYLPYLPILPNLVPFALV